MQTPAKHSAASSIEAPMHTLRQRYLGTMKDLLGPVEAALRHCENGTLTDDNRQELRHIAHRLAGTGETYGFPAITASARPIDDLLKSHPRMTSDELTPLIYPLIVACRNALGRDEIRGALPPRVTFGRRNIEPISAIQAKAHLPLLLVVDDDPAMRDLFTDLFSLDARILTATNSEEALAMMRLHGPDLVLLDDIMPGAVTGLKFLENLKKSGEFSGTPIIMITASDEPAHIDRGLNAGAADYITKPFAPIEMATTVRRHLQALR